MSMGVGAQFIIDYGAPPSAITVYNGQNIFGAGQAIMTTGNNNFLIRTTSTGANTYGTQLQAYNGSAWVTTLQTLNVTNSTDPNVYINPISGNTIIGSDTTNVLSSQLTVNSTTKGVLIPRMTTSQKNAILSPVEGLHVYDLTLHQNSYWNGSAWQNISLSGQVNSDWNATSGVAQILNKPTVYTQTQVDSAILAHTSGVSGTIFKTGNIVVGDINPSGGNSVTVTFSHLSSTNYTVLLTPVSLGAANQDATVTYAITNKSAISFTFQVLEWANSIQNISFDYVMIWN
jgi:hypothetical protein